MCRTGQGGVSGVLSQHLAQRDTWQSVATIVQCLFIRWTHIHRAFSMRRVWFQLKARVNHLDQVSALQSLSSGGKEKVSLQAS